MPRARGGFKTNRRRKKVLKRAKGFYGARSRLYKVATQAVDKALLHAYRDRRIKKREFRSLWIIRINAAVRALGMTYSQFMNKLKSIDIGLNRKALADLAYHDRSGYSTVKSQIFRKKRASYIKNQIPWYHSKRRETRLWPHP
jgi:large subunit ribosomal protein L20